MESKYAKIEAIIAAAKKAQIKGTPLRVNKAETYAPIA